MVSARQSITLPTADPSLLPQPRVNLPDIEEQMAGI